MNNNLQQIIIRSGAALAAILLLFPEYIIEIGDGGLTVGLGRSFIFAPPTLGARYGYIYPLGLIVSIASVAVICYTLWMSERSDNDKK